MSATSAPRGKLDGASVAIIVITILAIIAFGVFLYISYRQQKWVFAKYVPPPTPANAFHPLGGVVPLTPDEQAARKAAYTQAPT